MTANAPADAPADSPAPAGGLSFRHLVAEAKSLHLQPSSAHGVFQAASQFNCLEMVGPSVCPEDGVTRYYADRTQGPACAIACPAATVFRDPNPNPNPSPDPSPTPNLALTLALTRC